MSPVSIAAIWLVVVPLEAALSASRRVVAIASSVALGAAVATAAAGNAEGIVLAEANRNGARLPVTALVDQFYAQVIARGGRRWDTSSLINLLAND